MKSCTKCKKSKPLDGFSFRDKKGSTRQSRCKQCVKLHDAANYLHNKEKFRKRNKKIKERSIQENRENILKFLREHPCIDCGENDPIVLEFDHQRGKSSKKSEISNMTRNCSWVSIYEEIKKCVVRCANCHRRKTAQELGHYRASLGFSH